MIKGGSYTKNEKGEIELKSRTISVSEAQRVEAKTAKAKKPGKTGEK